MHLLLAQPGETTDGSEAIDLAQTPADVIIISAADTELAALAEARAAMPRPPSLRLASLLHLAHPMSVDLYLEATATRAKIVIARVLGGEGYWSYGLEQFAARLGAAGVAFAALPGDDKPDAALLRASTVPDADWHALWSLFVEGGPANITAVLDHAGSLARCERADPPTASPLLRAGVYWPGAGTADLSTARAGWRNPDDPVVPIVFYRALVQGAGLNPVNRLTRALIGEGLNPLPVFVASLKDPVSIATLDSLFSEASPSVIINATAFAVSSPQAAFSGTVLDRQGVPVLQAIFSGGTQEAWREGLNGLSARDIAMNVALPEVDGRIVTRAVSFKSEAYFDDATECRIASYRAEGTRIGFVAQQASAWVRLSATGRAERRVAIVLANYPNRDGRLANGVGLDAPQSVVDMLSALRDAGYQINGVPRDSAELMDRIQRGPTNWLVDRPRREGGVRLALDAYRRWYVDLPWNLR
ncbi:MAG: cobaltochelatase subunit CobN, partial [Pseudomonadota bacterium]